MNAAALAMALTVGANVAYHFCQRSIAPAANPVVSLLATYLVAITATVAMLLFFLKPGETIASAFGQLNWASYALGLAAVGLEIGFLIAYRAGWQLALAALYCNLIVTLLLIPIGYLVFREELSPRKMIGAAFALIGLWLMGS